VKIEKRKKQESCCSVFTFVVMHVCSRYSQCSSSHMKNVDVLGLNVDSLLTVVYVFGDSPTVCHQ